MKGCLEQGSGQSQAPGLVEDVRVKTGVVPHPFKTGNLQWWGQLMMLDSPSITYYLSDLYKSLKSLRFVDLMSGVKFLSDRGDSINIQPSHGSHSLGSSEPVDQISAIFLAGQANILSRGNIRKLGQQMALQYAP